MFSESSGPTALITGSTGFLGLNLVRELTAAGWRVIALHRPNAEMKYLNRFRVTPAVATLEDPTSLDKAMPPSPQDERELGVIVSSIGLQ